MPEGANIEVAQHLHERAAEKNAAGHEESRGVELLEVVEALLLAFVTIATAWSGYQAARWDGRNALHYGEASKYRAESTKEASLGGQMLVYDATTFNAWLAADLSGHTKVAAAFVRRFTVPYKIAFDAWMKLDPFTNPRAPAGPRYMPQYHNVQLEHSADLDTEAANAFEQGTQDRETADNYVRDTVLLASVLFLVAINQRFSRRRIRQAILGIAFVLLAVGVYSVATHPIA